MQPPKTCRQLLEKLQISQTSGTVIQKFPAFLSCRNFQAMFPHSNSYLTKKSLSVPLLFLNFSISLEYKGIFIVAGSLHSSNSLAVLAIFSNSSSTVSPGLIFAKRVKSGFIIFSCCTFFRLSSLFDDYPVLLTSFSEYRKHLPNLVNASWL